LLDQLAANAWPAQVQQACEGWRLRASGGVTRRANSVLTNGPVPTYAHWLEYVEKFYARRGLPPRFQISDASPEGLDEFLETQGYRAEAHSMVQTARAQTVVDTARIVPGLHVVVSAALEEAWLEAYITLDGAEESKKETYRAIFSAIGPPVCFARVLTEDARASAVALGVTERGWTGLFGIATHPEFRGRGIATHLVRVLSQWSLLSGAPNLYVQVMQTNAGAIRTYERLGFSRLYDYHYRTKDAGVNRL
jgi:ribosomal protein S18 acetylase RimI-like enzyme